MVARRGTGRVLVARHGHGDRCGLGLMWRGVAVGLGVGLDSPAGQRHGLLWRGCGLTWRGVSRGSGVGLPK